MRLALFICLCFIKFVETQLPDVIPVKWDTDYTRKSERNSTLTIFQFVVPRKNSVGRVIMSSDDSSESNPLLVVFREKREILSLQIPLIADNYVYSKVSRTLCPFTNYEKGETFTVEVTSSQRVEYRFRAELVHNFWLTNNSKHEVTASASEPVFLRYDIPVNVDSVAVHVQSDSDTCMTVSIQKIECPVFDLPDNVNSIGMHQTMTKSTTIPVEREKLPSFYVVFVVNNNDDLCTEIASIKPKRPTKFPLRQKTFNVTIESSMKQSDYAIPIIFWAAILLIITIIVLLYHHLDGKWEQRFIAHVYERLEADAENARLSDFYDIKRMSEDDDLKDYDILTDCKDMMVVRAKSRLTVADLSMREHEVREKQYDAYKHVLVVLFIFYNITVVQLLINQASSSRQSGDLDLCTFNFQCARPLWNFVAFNNVVSNAGYVYVGILIVAMNYFRNKNFKKLKQVQPSLEDRYGVPQHSGLMTAIGIAVIMEGFSSASYHVCPNNVNYQFDTALMYVIGMLGKLKIWSMRHPDMVVEAYHAFGFLGLILLAAIAGVYVHGMVLWIVISIIYIASILLISFEFYYKGIWSLNFRELRNSIRYSWASSRRLSCVVPAYKTRFFVILLLNISNIAVVVYGLYDRPKDFLSFLLFPFIGNLFMYIMYYIVMKIFHCESIPSRATVLLIAAFGLWFVASWFFTHHVSDWSKTPAISRELNKPCVFLDFYDNHDLWHLLSAFAIFASFTALNIIDDDLIFNSRNTIRVF